jgi:predicted nucleotidyltransferase
MLAARCDYFVAGATARDLVLVHVHGLEPGKATRDIDFAIAVENWDKFMRLKELLVATRSFEASRAPHRMMYLDEATATRIPIDLVPFGGIASSDGIIEWPPTRDTIMQVAGFPEVLRSSVLLEVEGFVVRVASLPGLVVMKLFAWSDRGYETQKDAVDLHQVIRSYAQAGNLGRLFGSESHLLESAGGDLSMAGAELLGCDVRRLCSPGVLGQIRALLGRPLDLERLILQMEQTTYEEARPEVGRNVEAFLRGIFYDE